MYFLYDGFPKPSESVLLYQDGWGKPSCYLADSFSGCGCAWQIGVICVCVVIFPVFVDWQFIL